MPHKELEVKGHERKWWKEGTAYQIYPASFKDSNDDGVGDIPGIITKLDYLKNLGVDIIWLSPHYKSPQVDMGYDISDFSDIHEPYGSMKDCDLLIHECHQRGIRIIFDLVINHCSDQHEWFKEARSSKTNPKRDWFIWRGPKYDENGNRKRPNNWRSNFSVPSWTWDENTEEYYLHLFASEQPDLNWENEDCRRAIYESAIKFWLDKGVDGFRVDTVNMYSKVYKLNEETGVLDLPDGVVTEPHQDTQFTPQFWANGPRMYEFLDEINDILAKYDVMTVGELPHTPTQEGVLSYISARERKLNMVFNFETVSLGQTPGARYITKPYTHSEFKETLSRWQNAIHNTDAWTTVFLENHDLPRSVSRFASDLPEYRVQAGKMLATILSTMSGTLFLYQGQEIGMINMPRTWGAEEYKCVKATNYWAKVKEDSNDDPATLSKALDGMQLVARDHARVPMQWDDSANAGFTGADATPWMRVVDTYKEINVQNQVNDEHSVLAFWKKSLALRKEYKDVFIYGEFQTIEQGEDLMVFSKDSGAQKSLTVANLTASPQDWSMPASFAKLGMKLLIGNDGGSEGQLAPFEGRVYISS